jgi:hypothetical protein
MLSFLEKAGQLWREFRGRLIWQRDNAPIDSVAALADFNTTRSAFVAQKTLYGYLKARIGTRYPRLFENDAFAASINLAKLQVFASCLSDLTIFSVAEASQDVPAGDATRRAIALHCYETALCEHAGGVPQGFSAKSCLDEFSRRLDGTDWRGRARERENFIDSPRALLKWAPIADELKQFDADIVQNSIKFAWHDVREQLRQRIDREAICADWRRLQAN